MGINLDADDNSISASTQDQKNTLPRRGTAALQKIARLEKQIQQEHLDLVTEDTLWKKKENRNITIKDFVNRGEEKEKKVKRTSREKGEDVQGKEEERETIMVEDVDEKLEEEEDRKMADTEEAAYQKRKAEMVK